jgi:hypothetical protein
VEPDPSRPFQFVHFSSILYPHPCSWISCASSRDALSGQVWPSGSRISSYLGSNEMDESVGVHYCTGIEALTESKGHLHAMYDWNCTP